MYYHQLARAINTCKFCIYEWYELLNSPKNIAEH